MTTTTTPADGDVVVLTFTVTRSGDCRLRFDTDELPPALAAEYLAAAATRATTRGQHTRSSGGGVRMGQAAS
jgi:hypothetical protein